MSTTFTCRYEIRINDFGGRAVRTKKIVEATAEGAVEKIKQELEAKGRRVLAIRAEGGGCSCTWYRGDPMRDL